MISATEFLLGKATPKGLTVKWILTASDKELEQTSEWLCWAFAGDMQSLFENYPKLAVEEAKILPLEAKINLAKLAHRFWDFLHNTTEWKTATNKYQIRIARALRALHRAGLLEEVDKLYKLIQQESSPIATALWFWNSTAELYKPEQFQINSCFLPRSNVD